MSEYCSDHIILSVLFFLFRCVTMSYPRTLTITEPQLSSLTQRTATIASQGHVSTRNGSDGIGCELYRKYIKLITIERFILCNLLTCMEFNFTKIYTYKKNIVITQLYLYLF